MAILLRVLYAINECYLRIRIEDLIQTFISYKFNDQ